MEDFRVASGWQTARPPPRVLLDHQAGASHGLARSTVSASRVEPDRPRRFLASECPNSRVYNHAV